jgi:thiol-disulfide isomerase/thioredoxin
MLKLIYTMSYHTALLWFIVFSLPLSLLSCQGGAPAASQEARQGFTLAAHDTLPYPVVENFADLAPLFSQQTDTTYVINFWATWCAPCVAELPYFEQLAAEYEDEAVRFVMVSLDFKREVDRKLLRFVQDRPFSLPTVALIDPASNVWIDQVEPTWTGAIPVTIIYRKDKRLFHDSSFADYAELKAAFLQIHR